MAAQIFGRSSSHYTRVTRIFAHELGVEFEFVPIHDITSADPRVFHGNPALKLPTLLRDGSALFGTENICRALADMAAAQQRIVWPEELKSDTSRNAHELVWHCMAAQVQLIFGTVINKLPADNLYFTKCRSGLDGALGWLDDNLAHTLEALPASRGISLFEVTLFCLIEHVAFRKTVPVESHARLVGFAREFGTRPSAQLTEYRFDAPQTPQVQVP